MGSSPAEPTLGPKWATDRANNFNPKTKFQDPSHEKLSQHLFITTSITVSPAGEFAADFLKLFGALLIRLLSVKGE
jgi:hypothetical protein